MYKLCYGIFLVFTRVGNRINSLMNKTISSIIAIFVAVVTNFAQTTYVGKVQSGNQALEGATLTAVNGKGSAITNAKGEFQITLINTQVVTIQYLGYETLKYAFKNDKAHVIALNPTLSSLEEVVVSASRELQERKEVPHAISVITSKKIAETKAFGFDQLINDTPGVYISSSRASSNEQHFTAARSPISTRPLFLFLEDGLPTRPTAIFNHNTLLERNQATYDRIEVLRGPAASIYGSDAIGGSFNFITKNPEDKLKGAFDLQSNTLGFTGANLDFGKNINKYVGFYIASQFNQRVGGPFDHSDYSKKALTAKLVVNPSQFSKFTITYNNVGFFTDMAGSIGEDDFRAQNFESDQTFTNRDAESSRIRLVWDQTWNENNKTSFSAIYRENTMIQNPSFRIRQNRTMGQLNGTGSGELNNNTFESYFGNVQHKMNFDALKSNLILGGTLDITKQDYVANRTEVTVDTVTRSNIAFNVLQDDFILNYLADINNYASYAQFEIAPVKELKITLGARYDIFEYDFDNRIEGGLVDSRDSWSNFSPKIGLNYNYSNKGGLFVNYSEGFTPPQATTLYRSRNRNEGLEPSEYFNYEIGSYNQINSKFKVDLAWYYLEGRNTLITIRDPESANGDAFLNTNAGRTVSYGIEYGFSYKPIKEIEISHNGTYAKHEYKRFVFNGDDFSNTDREIAPNIIGTSKISFRPQNGLNIAFEHELIGGYNTSLEGQASDELSNPDTTTYSGHNVFNFLVNYRYKKVEVWMQLLNIFDDLYANRVSFNSFRNENSYTVGNPRAFHFGARYNF